AKKGVAREGNLRPAQPVVGGATSADYRKLATTPAAHRGGKEGAAPSPCGAALVLAAESFTESRAGGFPRRGKSLIWAPSRKPPIPVTRSHALPRGRVSRVNCPEAWSAALRPC